MELSFRGAKYDYRPQTIEITEGEVGGTYRGCPWKARHHRQQPPYRLYGREFTYRGVNYRQGRSTL